MPDPVTTTTRQPLVRGSALSRRIASMPHSRHRQIDEDRGGSEPEGGIDAASGVAFAHRSVSQAHEALGVQEARVLVVFDDEDERAVRRQVKA
jgi:hypothetical protein